MSLRQAIKRSLVGASGDGTSQGVSDNFVEFSPAPAKKPRQVAPAKPKLPKVPRAIAAPGLPRMELEADEEREDEDADADPSSDDAAAEEAMPLKKRFAAHRQDSATDKVTVGHATSAPDNVGGDVIPEFDDGYDGDLMGDEEDRARLSLLSDVLREIELSKRAERRQLGQQNVNLRRQLQNADKHREMPVTGRRGVKGVRGAAAARVRAAASHDVKSSDSDSDAIADGTGALRPQAIKASRRGRPAGGRGGRASVAPVDAALIDKPDAISGDSPGSSSSSSSEESDRFVGGRRLRAAASRRGKQRAVASVSNSSSSSSDAEISAAVRRTNKASTGKGAHQRDRDLGSSSSSESDENDVSLGAIKDRKGYSSSEDGSANEYSDDDAAAVASSSVSALGISKDASYLLQVPMEAAVPALKQDLERPANLQEVNRMLLRRHQAARALQFSYDNELVRGTFVRYRYGPGPHAFRIARVVGFLATDKFYDPWAAEPAGPPRQYAAAAKRHTNKLLHVAIGSRDTKSDPVSGEALKEPRVVAITDLSNHNITGDEYDAYRQRMELQARRSARPHLDRVPSAGEAASILRRSAELSGTAQFSHADVNKILSAEDQFFDEKLTSHPNLTLVREQTIARIGTYQQTLPALGGDAYVKAKRTMDRLHSRLQKVTDEEARRKSAHQARDQQRLACGRDVSTLTNLINAKVDARNALVMDEVAAVARSRTMAQAAAAEEDNPFMRRRTAPTVLFRQQSGTFPEAAPVASSTSATAVAPSAGFFGRMEKMLEIAPDASSAPVVVLTGVGIASATTRDSADLNVSGAYVPSVFAVVDLTSNPGAMATVPAAPTKGIRISLADFRSRLKGGP